MELVASSPHAVGAGSSKRSGVANDVVVGNPDQIQNVDGNVKVVSDVVANNNDKRIVIFKNNKKS